MKPNGGQHSLIESILDASSSRATGCITAETGFDQRCHPVCWGHLETLNRCLPNRYKSPSYLLALIRRDLENPKED